MFSLGNRRRRENAKSENRTKHKIYIRTEKKKKKYRNEIDIYKSILEQTREGNV